ncbi:MAG: hypothetical protein V9F04_08640 [Dermatophilaceae bacterium]
MSPTPQRRDPLTPFGRRRTKNRGVEHSVLTPEQDKAQRGDSPPGSIGGSSRPDADLAPGWTPDRAGEIARELHGELLDLTKERRPRREDVYPYLMIRASSPGDRGARPTWPPKPCWESPDIALIDAAYTGPFDLSRLVVSPTAGRRYRVFVRIWNLGLLPAIGVHVRGWFVNPGFFGGNPSNPAYQPVLIGGAMVNLEDRTRPGATAVVELDRTWDIPVTLTGHECLMASVSCPLDPWSGALDANHDRHVGQRNLHISAGATELKAILGILGAMVTKTGTLEITHGMGAVTPLLRGVMGKTKTDVGVAARLRAPSTKAVTLGVAAGTGRHLLTMMATDRGWLVADSARVWRAAVEFGLVKRTRVPAARHPFGTPGATGRIIDTLGPDHAELFGVVLDADPADALIEGLVRLWELPDLSSRTVAGALVGDPSGTASRQVAHLLRLAHHDPQLQESGGYSLVVVG